MVSNVETCMVCCFIYFEKRRAQQYRCGFNIFLFFDSCNQAILGLGYKCRRVYEFIRICGALHQTNAELLIAWTVMLITTGIAFVKL